MKVKLPEYTVREVGEYSQLAQTIPWSVRDLNVPAAWEKTKGKGTTAIVIDTGYSDHPDNSNEIAGPWFVSKDPSSVDLNGHGSHVAGTIGAADNGGGVVGVAPESTIISVKGLNRDGIGSDVSICKALEWAIEQKPDVVNISLGSNKPNGRRMFDALLTLYDMGIPVVAAGGNFGPAAGVLYPAKWPMTFGIAAFDPTWKTADFSAAGPEIDFAAPGVGILSTYKDGQYATLDGTSMAAPFVTGTILLMKAMANEIGMSFDSVRHMKRNLIKYTTDAGEPGRDDRYGFGIVMPESVTMGDIVPPSLDPLDNWEPPQPPKKRWGILGC